MLWIAFETCFPAIYLLAKREGYPRLPSPSEGMTAEAMALLCVRESCSYLLWLYITSVCTSYGGYKIFVDTNGYEV